VQAAKRRTMIHLLNYNGTQVATARDTSVRVLLPEGAKATKATLRVPGESAQTELAVESSAGAASFSLPQLQHYALVTLQW